MSRLPANLPALLRAAGLTVVTLDGWRDRGRPGSFNPVGTLNHHTGASAKTWSYLKRKSYAAWMFLTGRSDLPAPLCQIALDPDGVVYIGAAGRANHAGTAKASGSVAGGDGNTLYIGIEWMLSGRESIPAKMLGAGITLNAVLTEKVTKTSPRAISAHYQTSVTGKWDIGDPNGIDFKGAKVLDVGKFRTAVDTERELLYHTPKPPIVGPHKFVTVKVAHLSGLYKNTPAQWAHDTERVLSRGYAWVTGTEVGADDDWQALRVVARKNGYRVKRYKSNWIAVQKRLIKPGSLRWGHETVIPKEQVAGAGHDTNMLWATFTHTAPGVGRVSVVASHYPTKGVPGGGSTGVNVRWTKKIAQAIAGKMAELGKGKALAFYGGDQNIADRLHDTFFGAPVTTCWDALGKYPNTGHGNIDVIASLKADKRVSCVSARTYNDKQLFLYGDHFLVEAAYRIEVS